MKLAVIIVRVLMGLIFLMASVMYFLNLIEQPKVTGDLLLFNTGLAASVYLMPLVKVVELVSSIALISGRYVALALIIIFPVTINIFLVHLFLDPNQIVIPILMLAANLFLFYAYRKHYSQIFVPRRIA